MPTQAHSRKDNECRCSGARVMGTPNSEKHGSRMLRKKCCKIFLKFINSKKCHPKKILQNFAIFVRSFLS